MENRVEYKYEILNNGVIQIRKTDIYILPNKTEIPQHFRYCLNPGDDVSNETEEIKAVCSAVWTENKIKAYKNLRSILA